MQPLSTGKESIYAICSLIAVSVVYIVVCSQRHTGSSDAFDQAN